MNYCYDKTNKRKILFLNFRCECGVFVKISNQKIAKKQTTKMTKIIKFQLIQRSMATSYTLLWIFLILNLLFRSCHCSTQQQPQQEQPSSKLGVHMVRSPESTVAPLRDEVLFECELNLEPERLDWRFRSLSSKGTKDDFIYLNKNVSVLELSQIFKKKKFC